MLLMCYFISKLFKLDVNISFHTRHMKRLWQFILSEWDNTTSVPEIHLYLKSRILQCWLLLHHLQASRPCQFDHLEPSKYYSCQQPYSLHSALSCFITWGISSSVMDFFDVVLTSSSDTLTFSMFVSKHILKWRGGIECFLRAMRVLSFREKDSACVSKETIRIWSFDEITSIRRKNPIAIFVYISFRSLMASNTAQSGFNGSCVCSVDNGAQVIPARSHAVSCALAQGFSSETLTSTITPPP